MSFFLCQNCVCVCVCVCVCFGGRTVLHILSTLPPPLLPETCLNFPGLLCLSRIRYFLWNLTALLFCVMSVLSAPLSVCSFSSSSLFYLHSPLQLLRVRNKNINNNNNIFLRVRNEKKNNNNVQPWPSKLKLLTTRAMAIIIYSPWFWISVSLLLVFNIQQTGMVISRRSKSWETSINW